MTDENRPDSPRAVKLVGGQTERGDRKIAKTERNLPDGLDCVAMQGNAELLAAAGNFLNRLNHAGFVIGQHHGDHGRRFEKRFRKGVLIDDAIFIDPDSVDRAAPFPPRFGCIQDAGMLNRRHHKGAVCTAKSRLLEGESVDRDVVRFGSAAREDQAITIRTIRNGAQDFADSLPRFFESSACPAARSVLAGRIRVSVLKARQQRVDDFRQDSRGRIVVEIDRLHHQGL